jgi:hypothetical protein
MTETYWTGMASKLAPLRPIYRPPCINTPGPGGTNEFAWCRDTEFEAPFELLSYVAHAANAARQYDTIVLGA